MCVLGDHITPVKYVSSSVVRCPVTGVSSSVKLCYEGLGCSNELALGRADAPVIDRAEPSVLPVGGGLVTFYGSGLRPSRCLLSVWRRRCCGIATKMTSWSARRLR